MVERSFLPFFPAFDDFIDSKSYWFIALDRAVEYCAVYELSFVMHRYGIA